MKYLIAIVLILLAIEAQAKLLEGADVSDRGSSASTSASSSASFLDRVQNRVTAWWSGTPKAVTSNATDQTRSVASMTPAATMSTTTLNQFELSQKVAELPSYSTAPVRAEVAKAVSADIQAIRSQKLVTETKPARLGDSSLPRTKSGVVKFDLGKKDQKSVAVVPRLDIGEEAQISRTEWKVQAIDARLTDFAVPKALLSPDITDEKLIVAAIGAAAEQVADARNINVSAFGPDGKVTFETVRQIVWYPKSEKTMNILEVKTVSEEEIKQLQAEILLESGKKCHLATGLLYELLDAGSENIRKDSLYQLSMCLHKMGLFTESTRRMSEAFRVVSANQIAEALKLAVKDLPQEFEEELRDELQKLSKQGSVPLEAQDAFHYIIAKASSRSGHYTTALESAEKVSPKFDRYMQAQFISAVSEYALGRQTRGYERMMKLKTDLLAKGGSEDLKSLVDINLGRMAFAEKKYKDSIAHFRDIKKDHPMWVDALIEQGWTQLLVGDASGAIGNMYSIQSPYFKAVYKPESFVVRTIGYLNICQYGDAYRTLTALEQEYRQWGQQIQSYRSKANTLDHYNSLVKYLRSSNTAVNVDGLPFQVLREIGRHKDFLNIQEAVNNRVDEIDQHKFLAGLIEKDRGSVKWLIKKSQERMTELRQKVKRAETNAQFAKDLNQLRQQLRFEDGVLDALKFELAVYDRSATKYATMSKSAQERVQKKKSQLQLAAGEVLKARLKRAETRLASILENNELLRYETFAGSGENIRFHATATGQSDKINSKRMPVIAKPETKELKWTFSGEYWADEIGHYRSSLKDNCPATQRAAAR